MTSAGAIKNSILLKTCSAQEENEIIKPSDYRANTLKEIFSGSAQNQVGEWR